MGKLILSLILFVGLGSGGLWYKLNMSGNSPAEQIFHIRSGESFGSVNYRLTQKKIHDSPRIFHKYAKWTNKIRSFKTGHFRVPPHISLINLLKLLTSTPNFFHKVTIPEGKNLFEIAEILTANKIVDKEQFIKACKDVSFIRKLGVLGPSVEGYLYPDTYQFSPQSSANEVIKNMVSQHFKNSLNLRAGTNSKDWHDIVILASIVEKETGAAFERPIIAGVFHNRLKKRMRLQSDPTTIYGIYETFNGNLKKKHLLEKTPYNTYKIKGLPLGPISNPGIDSLKAVIRPAAHSFLYFVSKNDGTHKFTTTYREHLKGVEHYQKNVRNRRNKSWRNLRQN